MEFNPPFNCPGCNAVKSWKTEPYFCGGTPATCSECKRAFTIPLYCPECDPPHKTVKARLVTPAGFLGGTVRKCPANHLFTVPVLTSEVHSVLGQMGTELGKYYQSERIEKLQDAKLKQAVSGGYCAGVALDWIRRALLGGKVTYAKDPNKRRDERAAFAWTEDAKRVDWANEEDERRTAALNKSIKGLNLRKDASFAAYNKRWDELDADKKLSVV